MAATTNARLMQPLRWTTTTITASTCRATGASGIPAAIRLNSLHKHASVRHYRASPFLPPSATPRILFTPTTRFFSQSIPPAIPPSPLFKHKKKLLFLAFLATLTLGGSTSLVLLQSTDSDMGPLDALGVAASGFRRLAVSLFGGAMIGVQYRWLFMQFDDYESAEYKAARSKVHKKAAEWILWVAEVQGGIYVKAGQHIASWTYAVPIEFTSTLSVLQDKAPFRPFSSVERVIKAEFGVANMSDIFLEFDEIPIAAASLAQVHRAVLLNGDTVAVKVQYPEVSRFFEVDTRTMLLLADLAALFFKDFSFTWIATEFRDNIQSEFDFKNEARNCELTHERFRHRRAAVRCPRVCWEVTSGRVLTMEFIDGVKVNDVEGLRARGLDPKKVGPLLCEAFSEMIFVHGVVHCDPHAGNMLVVNSPADHRLPQLVILDHGLYRTLDEEFRLLYCKMWKAILIGDMELLKEVAEGLGAGPFTKHLPLLFTGRPAGSATPLGKSMSQQDRQKLRSEFKDVKFSNVMGFLESMPRDMLFAVRVANLVRGIHTELGGENFERFVVNARYAVKGCFSIPRDVREEILGKRVDEITKVGMGKRLGIRRSEEVHSGGYVGLSMWCWGALVDEVEGWWNRVWFVRDYGVVVFRLFVVNQVLALVRRE